MDDLTVGHNLLFEKQNRPPMIFVCATMWHETPEEMETLVKSLLRYLYIMTKHPATDSSHTENTLKIQITVDKGHKLLVLKHILTKL